MIDTAAERERWKRTEFLPPRQLAAMRRYLAEIDRLRTAFDNATEALHSSNTKHLDTQRTLALRVEQLEEQNERLTAQLLLDGELIVRLRDS